MLEELKRRAESAAPGTTIIVDAKVLSELLTRLDASEAALRTVARAAVAAVEFSGQVVTVERLARRPLAMGNDVAFMTFRPKRGRA